MILLRHGQSEFNLHFTATRRDPGITDPRLTPLGHDQAEQAAQTLADAGVRRIVASPYTRALQTAAPLALRLGLPVLVDVTVRERYAYKCDIGSPVADLQQAWPGHDFSAVEEVWWPSQDEPEAHVIQRAARFRSAMAADPAWRDTVVVSHWGFILAMTGTSVANGEWLRCDPTAPAPAEIVWRHPPPRATGPASSGV
jgi:broad specificity phosphatase PhoE